MYNTIEWKSNNILSLGFYRRRNHSADYQIEIYRKISQKWNSVTPPPPQLTHRTFCKKTLTFENIPIFIIFFNQLFNYYILQLTQVLNLFTKNEHVDFFWSLFIIKITSINPFSAPCVTSEYILVTPSNRFVSHRNSHLW